ncbi:hypothetical protein SAMN04488123_10726 [Natribacillus halophilus]|uniref:Uncharacterized protein n=1 Tax=Natribacillus halophilus TaxID=549003 RepID=A0A1G8NTT7_9BACI|nr:hypothetical protein SAMN04488123_10726 [Natribacillus halophilus]
MDRLMHKEAYKNGIDNNTAVSYNDFRHFDTMLMKYTWG